MHRDDHNDDGGPCDKGEEPAAHLVGIADALVQAQEAPVGVEEDAAHYSESSVSDERGDAELCMQCGDVRLALHLFVRVYNVPTEGSNSHRCTVQIAVQLRVLVASDLLEKNGITLKHTDTNK